MKFIFCGILGYILFHPILFCPFGLPYIYCSICYRRCLQGSVRWILLGCILALNLWKRYYCSTLCPCGTLQDIASKVKVRRFTLPPLANKIRFFGLGILVSLIIMTEMGYLPIIIEQWTLIGFVVATGIISFFIHRFWCRILCPIGAVLEMILRTKGFIHLLRR